MIYLLYYYYLHTKNGPTRPSKQPDWFLDIPSVDRTDNPETNILTYWPTLTLTISERITAQNAGNRGRYSELMIRGAIRA